MVGNEICVSLACTKPLSAYGVYTVTQVLTPRNECMGV